MVQFYVPWTERHPLVTAGAPPGTIWIDLHGEEDYWSALCRIWAKGESFAIIEHDVICRPDVVEQFASCPEPWCAFWYDNICHFDCREAWANQLGCTRFRSDVMAKCPDALTSIPPDQRGWHNLCDHIAGDKLHGTAVFPWRSHSIRAAGFSHHWHSPPVEHHPWFESR